MSPRLVQACALADGLHTISLCCIRDSGLCILRGLCTGPGELKEPALSGLLEGKPIGVMPGNDPRQVPANLPSEPRGAVWAVAETGPEGHIEEYTLKIIILAELLYLSYHKIPIARVGTTNPIAAIYCCFLPIRSDYPPLRMILIRPVVID